MLSRVASEAPTLSFNLIKCTSLWKRKNKHMKFMKGKNIMQRVVLERKEYNAICSYGKERI